MYPQRYYELFPAFPTTLDVFVAMSFHERFDARYENVIKPGIEAVRIGTQHLKPIRVDARVISDSILTEILNGIGKSRIVFVELTCDGVLEDGRAIRNGNVMYELGIAHSTRIPEEVVLFRSDDNPLLFDTANIRVNKYDPDGDPENAKRFVAQTVLSAIREVDLRRNAAVTKAASSLDVGSWSVLNQAIQPPGVKHMPSRTISEAVGSVKHNTSILRLLDMGAIEAEFKVVTRENVAQVIKAPDEDLVVYRATPFGGAICAMVVSRMRLTDPDVQAEAQMQAAMTEQLTIETKNKKIT